MDTKVNYTLVGAFVLILSTAIVFAIIWLSSGFSFEKFTMYKVIMQESVTGLSVDSSVEFNGVDVGKVKSIKIDPLNPKHVELLLSIKNHTPITQGTVATLNTKGVTGITYLALKDQSNDLRPLLKKEGDEYPIIKTAPSLFKRLDTVLSQLSTNLQKITDSIQDVLDEDNLYSIKHTLIHLRTVTGQLEAQTLPMTNQLLNNLTQTTQHINQLTSQFKNNPTMLIRGVHYQANGPGEK